MTLGGSPRSVSAATDSGARGSGTAESSSWVYGCLGLVSTSSIGPVSAICPAYITISRSATYRALAMSWVMYRMDTPIVSRSSAIRLSRPILIDTSSIETGSSARISFGRIARAWANPTRWRCPPDSSWGNRSSMSAPRPTTSNTRAASSRRWAPDSSRRCSLRLRSTPCWTRNTGFIDPNGSWNTIGTRPL